MPRKYKYYVPETSDSALLQKYTDHVYPQWVRLADLFQMDAPYRRWEGVELNAGSPRDFRFSTGDSETVAFRFNYRVALRPQLATTFRHVHSGVFGEIVVMRLYNDHGILTQTCGNTSTVLNVAAPPVTRAAP